MFSLARSLSSRYLGAMSDARKPPAISALLTVYNKAPFLPDTIRSLRRQAEDESEVEYVFVDDGSSDDSVSIIKTSPLVRGRRDGGEMTSA